jgi:transcriptional regulator with XRE-family HTH domain
VTMATVTAASTPETLASLDLFRVDETSMSQRWRELLLGIAIVASTTVPSLPPSSRLLTNRDRTTSPARLPTVQWQVALTQDLPPSTMSASLSADATAAIAALARIRTALRVTEEQAAAMVGIARGSVRNWRQGKASPYPATVRRLFEVDALVTALSVTLGDSLPVWLQARNASGATRMATLAEPGGSAHLMDEVSSILFPTQSVRLLPSADELDTDDLTSGEAEPAGAVWAPGARPFAGLANQRRLPRA